MKLEKFKCNQEVLSKNIFISSLVICTIFSEVFIRNSIDVRLTISSFFIFLIIGMTKNKTSFIIVSLLNLILFVINGFNILTLIEALEVYYIWIYYKADEKDILIRVLKFWLLAGLPLIFITGFIAGIHLSVESVFFVLLICLNRIFNALAANFLLDYAQLQIITGVSYIKTKTITRFLVYTCISSIVLPVMIFFLITNFSAGKQVSEMAVKDLKDAPKNINHKISLWDSEDRNYLKVKNSVQVYEFTDLIKIYESGSDNYVDFYLLDLNNKTIASKNTTNYMKKGLKWLESGDITKIDHNVYRWTAPNKNKFIVKSYVDEHAYLYVTSINGIKMIIAVSEAAYTSKYVEIYINLLKILLPFSLCVAFFIVLLKRIILNSISKLIEITNDLPERLKNKENVVFGKSNILEIDLLTDNFQTMTNNLSSMISNIESANVKLQESEKMLFEQAHFDALTKLPNRHYFVKHVSEIMKNFSTNKVYRDKQGMALFFLDLDKFKRVNDTFGHSTGDKLLIEVARRMKNILDQYGTLHTFIGRLGGDEFVIEFIYNDEDEIKQLAENIIGSINKPIVIDNNEFNVGTSIGICLYPKDGEDIESIFIKSDTSMYKAKYSGGNKFIFYFDSSKYTKEIK